MVASVACLSCSRLLNEYDWNQHDYTCKQTECAPTPPFITHSTLHQTPLPDLVEFFVLNLKCVKFDTGNCKIASVLLGCFGILSYIMKSVIRTPLRTTMFLENGMNRQVRIYPRAMCAMI